MCIIYSLAARRLIILFNWIVIHAHNVLLAYLPSDEEGVFICERQLRKGKNKLLSFEPVGVTPFSRGRQVKR